jgi:hypothetical protein
MFWSVFKAPAWVVSVQLGYRLVWQSPHDTAAPKVGEAPATRKKDCSIEIGTVFECADVARPALAQFVPSTAGH